MPMKPALLLAVLFGLPLAAFIAASPFYPISHSTWLRFNNTFVVATLGGVALLGYILRGESWPRSIQAMACYTLVIAGLFMAAYLISTWYFSGDMKWIPLFHRDYAYHQYSSVAAYLFTGTNYIELVKLHLFSWMVFSVVYVGVGALATAASRCFSHPFRHG